MDVGPIRGSRPTERRAAAAPSSQTHHQSEEPQPVREEAKSVYRGSTQRPPESKKGVMRIVWPIITVLLVIALLVTAWFAWFKPGGTGSPAIDSDKYQAVFFTNGQVYFGKLQTLNGEYLKLTDIYYLQSQQTATQDQSNPQQTTDKQNQDQSKVQLIKLGDEIHGPEDAMVISKDQVLFYENIKPDGKVAQSIDQYKGSK
ncbi:hypothetical protein GII36_05560 [Candidatus Mycosynbacter amalyticus]|uniref:Uncharacterized protein n=1 Tax=Candidatus Mycosynbacter amalyticus TaxID=2665156 RepID=A0A857MN53_9BACT|nr:hypothetical protein [Candidatus Mycosynbacter amalyticus]QHN43285.1 hypothetical protein GII36_05560 [Candidatus Mycosynbacter amalyticus]